MPRWPHFPRAYVQQAQDASVAVCLSWDILRNVLPPPLPEKGRARTFQLGVPVSLDAGPAGPEAVLAGKLHFFFFQVSDSCCFVIRESHHLVTTLARKCHSHTVPVKASALDLPEASAPTLVLVITSGKRQKNVTCQL